MQGGQLVARVANLVNIIKCTLDLVTLLFLVLHL